MSRWSNLTLGDVLELKRGYDLPTANREAGHVPIISSSGPSDFHSEAKVQGPGVITGRYGTIGQIFFTRDAFWPLNTSLYVRDFKGNDPLFCYYFLKILDWNKFNDKSGVPGVNRNDVHQEPVLLPPLAEQRKIASILGVLDDKIELNRRMAVTLEEMARSLYRSWFVDFDPVHAKLEGRQPAFMDEETAALFPDRFGEDGLPEGWRKEGLLDQADWVNGAAYKNMHFSNHADALPVVKIAELKAGITVNTKFTATDLGEKFHICRGELLFSWSGNPDTSIDAFIWALGDAWLNQHIFAVRSNGKMSKAMLFSCLRFFNPEMAEIARNKQTTGLGHITRRDLEAFPICVADQSLVRCFEKTIQPLFDRYCDCLYQNQTLANLRDTLLPKLMSGELRVGQTREQIEEVA